MQDDFCDEFIDQRSEPERHELKPSHAAAPGEVRCSTCGWQSFERLGVATVTHTIQAIAGFANEVTIVQTSPVVAEEDFQPTVYRCTWCGAAAYDFADVAVGRPWTIGARAVLPDGTAAIIEAAGPERIMGNHREPTAICAGAAYRVRDLVAVESIHPDQLAFVV
jgi:hypothetical protein